MRFTTWFTVCFTVAFTACGPVASSGTDGSTGLPADTVTSVQANSKPTGTIQGYVTDGLDGSNIDGATVALLSDGQPKSVTTAAGAYVFTAMPAGSYRLTFTKAGYVKRIATVIIPASAGNFPSSNVVVEYDQKLVPANATIAGTVKTYGGTPIPGARVSADLRSQGFESIAIAVSAADGTFQLHDLPGDYAGLPITVVAGPVDNNADGKMDFGSARATVITYPGITSNVNLRLSQASGQLIANGGFEGSAGCSLDGWRVSPSSGTTMPTTVTTPVTDGSCAARLGAPSPGLTSALSGTSSLSQDVQIPAGVTQVTFSAAYSPDTNFATVGHDRQYCELRSLGGSSLKTLFDTISNGQAYTSATVDAASLAGTTVTVFCAVFLDGSHSSGMYLDAVSLIAQ